MASQRLIQSMIESLGPVSEESLAAASRKDEKLDDDRLKGLIAILVAIIPLLLYEQQTDARKLIKAFNSPLTHAEKLRHYNELQTLLGQVNISNKKIMDKLQKTIEEITEFQLGEITAEVRSNRTKDGVIQQQQRQLDKTTQRLVEYLEATGQAFTEEEADNARKPENEKKKSIPQFIEFRTMRDDRVDDQCRPFDGVIFNSKGEGRPIMPLHWGCRCKWLDPLSGRPLGQF